MMNTDSEMSSWLSRCHDSQTIPNHRTSKRVDDTPILGGVGVTLDTTLGLLGPVMSNFSDEDNDDDDEDDLIGSLLDTCQDESTDDGSKMVDTSNESVVNNQASKKMLFIQENNTISREMNTLLDDEDDVCYNDINLSLNGHNEIVNECTDMPVSSDHDMKDIQCESSEEDLLATETDMNQLTDMLQIPEEDCEVVIAEGNYSDKSEQSEDTEEQVKVPELFVNSTESDGDIHPSHWRDTNHLSTDTHDNNNKGIIGQAEPINMKRRNRKQNKPRCLKYMVSSVDNSECDLSDNEIVSKDETCITPSEDVSEFHSEIRKEPFCSNLYKPKKERRTKRTAVPNTNCTDIWSIIDKAFEKNMSSGNETTRYRYAIEEDRNTYSEFPNKDTSALNAKEDCIIVVEPKSPEKDNTFDVDGDFPELSCKDFVCDICLKSFEDAKTFASHYVSHSVFEKEQAFLKLGDNAKGYQLDTIEKRQKKPETVFRESRGKCKDKEKVLEVKHKNLDIKIKREPEESAASTPLFKGLWDSLDLSQFKNAGPLPASDITSSISMSDSITYFCHVCNKKFTNILDLQQHMTEHDGLELDDKADSSSEHNYSPCLRSPMTSAASCSLRVQSTLAHCDGKQSRGENEVHLNDGILHQGESKMPQSDHPYTCHTCNKTFRDKTRLTTHVRVHTGEKPYKCHVCFKSFSQKGNLKLHQKIHTGEKDCHCGICRHSFRSKSDLNRHLKVHGVDGDDKDSSSMEGLSSSRQSTPSIDDCQSPIVETPLEVFLRRDNRPASIRPSTIRSILEENDIPVHPSIALLSTKSETYSLAQLESLELLTSAARNFSFLEPLKHHSSLPHSVPREKNREQKPERHAFDFPKKDWLPLKPEEKNLMLSIDNEVEFIKAMTNAKTASEKGSKPQSFPCPLCSASLTSYDSLNHHILAIHGPLMSPLYPPLRLLQGDGIRDKPPVLSPTSKKLYRCQECKMEFSSFTVFQCHLKTHSDSPQHKRSEEKCLICGQYVNLGELGEHMMAHAVEKTYKCEFCMKVFRRSHHLQTHLRTHTGDKPYICLECNKRFSRGDHLQNHKRTHTGEKPYQCDICYKTYSQSHHLLRHKRTHTGERPYKCIMCNKTFSRDHHLKKHMETHKVLMFTDKAPNIPLQKPTSSKPHSTSTSPYVPVTSIGGSTIEQLIDSELHEGKHGLGPIMMENSASRLMERLVKKRMEEDFKDGHFRQGTFGSEMDMSSNKRHVDAIDDVRQINYAEESEKSRERSRLRIADLLADVDSSVPAEISSKLVANHLLTIAHRSKVGNENSNQQLDASDKKSGSKRKKTQDGYKDEHKVVSENHGDFSEIAKMFGSSGEEKMTLEDIVNRKLMQEYGLII